MYFKAYFLSQFEKKPKKPGKTHEIGQVFFGTGDIKIVSKIVNSTKNSSDSGNMRKPDFEMMSHVEGQEPILPNFFSS